MGAIFGGVQRKSKHFDVCSRGVRESGLGNGRVLSFRAHTYITILHFDCMRSLLLNSPLKNVFMHSFAFFGHKVFPGQNMLRHISVCSPTFMTSLAALSLPALALHQLSPEV